MLDGVVDRYLQGVSEREFDMPLMALLVSRRFYDIHKLHGAYEFGKDFIAKREDDGVVYQYAIQSKAGDINQRTWRDVRPQIEEARYNSIAHPSYSKSLPRKAILVTTGRLVGAAAADAQEYRAFLSDRGEISFEVWDQDDLRDWLIHDPACGMAGVTAGDLLSIIAAAENGPVGHQQLERYTRKWTAIPLHRVAIEAAVIANKLRACRRADLAATTALCALRAARSQDADPQAQLFAITARELHASYSIGLLCTYQEAVSAPESLLHALDTSFPHVAYPIICHRLAEAWGLLAMAEHVEKEIAEAARTAVRAIVSNQPGMSRPLSDRWAVSLMCATLPVFPDSPDEVAELLKAVIVWIADAYENGPGLASGDCSELEEIEYVLGASLAHIEVRTRRISYLATMVIDLCAFFGLRELYLAALNDFRAVGAVPTMVVADERVAKWGAGEFGTSSIPHVRYKEELDSGTPLASHHSATPVEGLSAWDAVALACLSRNRHPFWAFDELCRINPLGRRGE
jgi:hypothetical protein